jgi:hypothetical protein
MKITNEVLKKPAKRSIYFSQKRAKEIPPDVGMTTAFVIQNAAQRSEESQ